jgi:hypothetical protein
MNFRLTQRLAKKIKVAKLTRAPLHVDRYADWTARLFTADRTPYILISHTQSLYSAVMFGQGITDDNRFLQRALDALRETMEDDGLELIYANFVGPASASVRFCGALDRSVTGSMNELEAEAKYLLSGGDMAPFDVGFQLNATPVSVPARVSGSRHYLAPRDAITSAPA